MRYANYAFAATPPSPERWQGQSGAPLGPGAVPHLVLEANGDGQAVLVCAGNVQAIRSGASFHEMGREETARLFLDTAVRDPRGLRLYASQTMSGNHLLHRIDDHELRQYVLGQIARGALVGIRRKRGLGAGATSTGPELHRVPPPHDAKAVLLGALLRDIKAYLRGPLCVRGDWYDLALAQRWTTYRNRGGVVVPKQEAAKILADLAAAAGTSKLLSALLTRACDALSRDWRPPTEPDGLVLVRRKRFVPWRATAHRPVCTPSELLSEIHPPAIKTRIDFRVVDQDGNGVAQCAFQIRLPNGESRSGTTDVDGSVGIGDLEPGQCEITFPGLEDASCWIPEKALPGRRGRWNAGAVAASSPMPAPGQPASVPTSGQAPVPPTAPTGAPGSTDPSRQVRLVVDDPCSGFVGQTSVEVLFEDGETASVQTDGAGSITIPGRTGRAELTIYRPGEVTRFPIYLSPPSFASEAGAWQRLANLGYTRSRDVPDSPPDAQALQKAIQQFQADHRLGVTGTLDARVAEAIRFAHDGDDREWHQRDWVPAPKPTATGPRPKET